MRSWIFQANPDRYDIDGLLASDVREVLFSANQSFREMQPGEDVYIWRSAGSESAVSGIVAKGHILDTPQRRVDEGPGARFWRQNAQAETEAYRVRVVIDEVADTRGILKRDWMINDPVLSDLGIIKFANASNFKLEGDHLERIEDLWANTGVDWTRAESLAALRVYQITYGGTVSKKPGSPIADAAQLIGRAVGGVYNKVMNFRAIDPRDNRKGLSGAGDADRQVWHEFFDASEQAIDVDRLEREFNKLWALSKDADQVETPELGAKGSDASESSGGSYDYRYRPGPSQRAGLHTIEVKRADTYFVYVLALTSDKALKIGV